MQTTMNNARVSPKSFKEIINSFNNAAFVSVVGTTVITFNASCFAAEGIANEVAKNGYKVTRNYGEGGAFAIDRANVSASNSEIKYGRGHFQAYTISDEITFEEIDFKVQRVGHVID